MTMGPRLTRIHVGCWQNPDPKCGENTITYWQGYPIATNVKIQNPKNMISSAFDKTRTLADQMADYSRWAPYSLTPRPDLVDAMVKVTKAADEIEEAQRKEFIANFISVIFMLVPVAGEAAANLSLPTLRTIIAIGGELANVGMTVYDLIESPDSALMTVFGFLFGGGVSLRLFKEAADARRGLTGGQTEKLGPRIRSDLATINSMRGMCFHK